MNSYREARSSFSSSSPFSEESLLSIDLATEKIAPFQLPSKSLNLWMFCLLNLSKSLGFPGHLKVGNFGKKLEPVEVLVTMDLLKDLEN